MTELITPGVPGRYWHRARGRPHPVRRLPARLPAARGPARPVLRARPARTTRWCSPPTAARAGFCVDPIEKKPLNHFLPGTPVLSFGTAGCNLACKFCQNWDISQVARDRPAAGRRLARRRSPRRRVRLGCRSVAFTYNDPVIFLEYAIDVADACRERGIKAVAVTAGYICAEPRREFFAHMDAANVDLKAFTEDFYHASLCGAPAAGAGHAGVPAARDRRLVRDHHAADPRATTTRDAEIDALSALDRASTSGPDVPLHFTAFHPDCKMLDTPATPPRRCRRRGGIAPGRGAAVRLHRQRARRGGRRAPTVTPARRTLIGRDWYDLTVWSLTADGCCGDCGTPCAGVFEGRPGTWGRRRRPMVVRAHAVEA